MCLITIDELEIEVLDKFLLLPYRERCFGTHTSDIPAQKTLFEYRN